MPRWLLYTFLTMLLWGGWGLVSKPLSNAMSPWQVQALSSLGLLPVLAPLVLSPHFRTGSNRRRGIVYGFIAGLAGSAGNVACYQAMAAGGKAAAVIPLTSLYPLVTIVLARVVLRERLNPIQLCGIGISLLALFVLNVGGNSAWLTPWLLVALIPVALWGVAALLQKLATFHATTELSTFAFLLGFAPLAAITPLVQPMKSDLSGATWGLLLSLGLLFGLGNLTLMAAYARGGRAAIVTPLASLYSLVTIPLAVLLLGEKIAMREAAGIGLALIAVGALSIEKPVRERPARAADL